MPLRTYQHTTTLNKDNSPYGAKGKDVITVPGALDIKVNLIQKPASVLKFGDVEYRVSWVKLTSIGTDSCVVEWWYNGGIAQSYDLNIEATIDDGVPTPELQPVRTFDPLPNRKFGLNRLSFQRQGISSGPYNTSHVAIEVPANAVVKSVLVPFFTPPKDGSERFDVTLERVFFDDRGEIQRDEETFAANTRAVPPAFVGVPSMVPVFSGWVLRISPEVFGQQQDIYVEWEVA